MLDIQVSIEGDRVIIEGLESFAKTMPKAVKRGLERAAKGVHREAYEWLSGTKASSPGGYPVPVVTEHLRRMLNWLRPGEIKDNIRAGEFESIVYNRAEYAAVIHEGTHTSKKYGKRPFLEDALRIFSETGKIERVFEDEIKRQMERSGL